MASVGSSWRALVELVDLEVAHERVADGELLLGVVLQPGQQPVGREHEQARVGERAEQHQHVLVRSLAADLLRVDPRGLVAVVAVGDQQLGVGQRHLELGDQVLVGGAPDRVLRAVEVGRRCERRGAGDLIHRASGGAVAIGEQAEDGGEVGAGGARELEPVLLGARVRALVRADAARPVLIHAHAREDTGAAAPVAVGRLVVLAEHPDRRLVLVDERAPRAPVVHRGGGLLVAGREVDLDDVVGAAGSQPRPQLVIDHVVGRGDHVLERAHDGGLVAERVQRLEVGHRRRHPSAPPA